MAMAASGEAAQACAAGRMWEHACHMLSAPRGRCSDAWSQIVATSSNDGIWHSLQNCVAYQAEVWKSLLESGIDDVMQPAAFRMALVLRHTPTDLAVKILHDMLNSHPECQDLTSYVLALLTEDEARESPKSPTSSPASPAASPGGPVPTRDLLLYADCELAVLAAPAARYDEQARLVREEYSHLDSMAYSELRLKVLNQFSLLPNLFFTPEFQRMDAVARDNMKRELKTLREQR